MGLIFSDADIQDLFALVQNGVYRDSSGFGNNETNPEFGAADNHFVRLTTPDYTDGANGIRETINTPREISNIVSNQDNLGVGYEQDLPNTFGGTAFLTFFGQYFDHGLDFVDKGAPGSVSTVGTPDFPITAPRANWADGTGIDPDGIPNSGDEVAAQHVNDASPFVDQNQAYGSHDAITDLLREWRVNGDGVGEQTAYLKSGALDASGFALLPTLDDIRENYRIMTNGQDLTAEDITNYDGTGQPLLIDFIPVFKPGSPPGQPELDIDALGHYFIAGDGRANENVMLTSIHTVWARNHNWWVDELKERTDDTWSEEQYFEGARTMNIMEYQRVVFAEFAEAMSGGDDGVVDGELDLEHGFNGYDDTIDAAISAEFAHVAYRFGHSMLNEEVTFIDQETGQQKQISLVDAFLKPQNVNDFGIDGLLAGSFATPHQAIDEDMVNALRNQLVGRPLDLAALNIFRGRDTGVAAFNEVRTQLFAATGNNDLEPYTGWDDFQTRNNLSDEFIEQLQEAYPEGFEAMDLWIGGLAELPTVGQLGSTFGYIFNEQMSRLQDGDRFYYLELFDNELFLETNADFRFTDILERVTGLTDLPENVFKNFTVTQLDENDNEFEGGDENDLILALEGDDEIFGLAGDDDIRGSFGDDILSGGNGDDVLKGEEDNDILNGGNGNDALHGGHGDDRLQGGSGNDSMWGGAGDDIYIVRSTDDAVYETVGEGYDRVYASANFTLDAGQEVEFLRALDGGGGIELGGNEFGNRLVSSSFDDVLSGGTGNDVFIVNGPGDTVLEAVGEGYDKVFTSTDFTLDAGQEVEVLQAHNAGGGIALGGNEFNNQLISSSSFDDAMSGGAGNDSYIVNSTGDTVFEAVGEGLDRVIASADFTLGAGQEVELLYASNTGGGISLTGNEFANRFFSSGLDDIMSGGAGDDAFFVNDTGDTVLEAAGEGSDRVVASVDFTLGTGQEIEGLYASQTGGGVALSGNELDNRIVGNAADNTIEGGVGSDLMTGAGGSDVFVFSSGSGEDTITDFDSDAVGGQDLLDISALGVTDASFMADVTISQLGARTILEIGTETVNLNSTDATTIDQSDFLLAM